MHEIVVPKDTTIIMSIINYNRDPALWGPDSYEWKPERWLSPLPDTIMEAPAPGIYSHLWVTTFFCIVNYLADHQLKHGRMTFLGGGRACM